jgi:DNA topoisomerase VI subunit B
VSSDLQPQNIRTSPQLTRTTFETSRRLEYFNPKELQMQIGHPQELWPLALLKELIDNGLDIAEIFRRAPVIDVKIEDDSVTVEDNGPGFPLSTLERSVDYMVRVSDKNYYVSPTRGQLGNALKVIWAAPFVVDGSHGKVEITTAGKCYRVDVQLDLLSGQPRISISESSAPFVKTGTSIKMHWPQVKALRKPTGTLLQIRRCSC